MALQITYVFVFDTVIVFLSSASLELLNFLHSMKLGKFRKCSTLPKSLKKPGF